MKDNILLQVNNLSIGFPRQQEQNREVVNQISFTLEQGEILGIVGESGSGKTLTALSIMGLLPKDAQITEGSILFCGKDILKVSTEDQRALKGSKMAMIFQEPMTSFNPLLTIGAQVEEMLRLHRKCNGEEYKQKTLSVLREAGLTEAEHIYHQYPHQLSGGMRQRAMIAMAMIAGPSLLIADEPTTALDVTIQDKILKLLKKINQKYHTAIILVSHDLGVIKSICDNTLVMKDGVIVERGKAKDLFLNPRTDYTRELVAAAPAAWIKQKDKDIILNLGSKNDNVKGLNASEGKEPVLAVSNLTVYYSEHIGKIFGRKIRKHIVKNVSLSIDKGEALGVVGESGSGKSTLAKAIAGLIKDTEGIVSVVRPQMVFQDPYGSLNPIKKIGWILEEPLRIHGHMTKEERKAKVDEIIGKVGLTKEHLQRKIFQLSGGQRQRVAIAAALMLNPELIILDEPVSSLDVTVQAQILKLLKELQQQYQLSYLFISHDLNVVYQVCDRVCVMYQGEIVETRRTSDLFFQPEHEYSKELLKASIPE